MPPWDDRRGEFVSFVSTRIIHAPSRLSTRRAKSRAFADWVSLNDEAAYKLHRCAVDDATEKKELEAHAKYVCEKKLTFLLKR